MAVIQREVRKRGLIGNIFKWLFIAFNLFMAYALFVGLGNTGEVMEAQTSEAGRAGAAFGTLASMGLVLTFWALGDIILGMLVFFTRGEKTIITEDA